MYNTTTRREILEIYSYYRPENYRRFISGRLRDLRANLNKYHTKSEITRSY